MVVTTSLVATSWISKYPWRIVIGIGRVTVIGFVEVAVVATVDSVEFDVLTWPFFDSTEISGRPTSTDSVSFSSYILTSTETKYFGRSWGDNNWARLVMKKRCNPGHKSGCSKYGSIPGNGDGINFSPLVLINYSKY